MSTVFIVMQGENHEGGSVVAVASSLEAARRAAVKFAKEDDGWPPYRQVWKGCAPVGEELASWGRGCDWMNIREHTVQAGGAK